MDAVRLDFVGVLDADPSEDGLFGDDLAYSGFVIFEPTVEPKETRTSPGNPADQLTTTTYYDVVAYVVRFGGLTVVLDSSALEQGIEIVQSTSQTSDAVQFIGSSPAGFLGDLEITELQVNLRSFGLGDAFDAFTPADIADNYIGSSLFFQDFVLRFRAGEEIVIANDQNSAGEEGTEITISQSTLIEGGVGDDTLDGTGPGGSQLLGGEGDDVFLVDDAGDQVVEFPGEGIDTVRALVSYVLSDDVEILELLGEEAINATGNALNNVIKGNVNDNVLDGGAGADTLTGDSGNDTYIVDDPGDVVIESDNAVFISVSLARGGRARLGGGEIQTRDVGDNIDSVVATVSFALTDFVENLTLDGAADIDGTGNELDNQVIGNSGDNLLSSGAGALDELTGGGGNDTFNINKTTGNTVVRDDPGEDDVLDLEVFAGDDGLDGLSFSQDPESGVLSISNAVGGSVRVEGFFDERSIRFIDLGSGSVDLAAAQSADDIVSALALQQTDCLEIIDDDGNLWNSSISSCDGGEVSVAQAQVFRTYFGTLGREPDIGGYEWWLNEINESRHDLRSMAAGFIFSEEFTGFFGAPDGNSIDNADFVNHMYQNVFGREPDEGGFAFWFGELDSGNRTQTDVLVDMTQSNEYVELTAQNAVDFLIG